MIRAGSTAAELRADASTLAADLNDDALREALAAADWDPEPDLPVYP